MDVKIKTALISVSDKAGVVDFAKKLSEMGVKIISTGGTARALSDAGVSVAGIESVTGFPEMMDGRVKTLHPKIHGGLLGLRDKAEHAAAMEKHSIDRRMPSSGRRCCCRRSASALFANGGLSTTYHCVRYSPGLRAEATR